MIKYTIEDLQVFVLTYNRPVYLERMILSVLKQSLRPKLITVLDNGTNAETVNIVNQYKVDGVQYVNTSRSGIMGNVLTAQKLVKKQYVGIFHDDDLMHPDYLAFVIRAINLDDHVNLVTCDTMNQPLDKPLKGHPRLHSRGHVFDKLAFSTFVYNSERPSFAFAIYSSTEFKSIDFEKTFQKEYGKWGDTPLMIESVGTGKCIMFMDQCAWSGVHPGRDSKDPNTLPDAISWINLEKYFNSVMGDCVWSFSGFSFCMMNYRHLRSGYKRRVKKTMSYQEYMRTAKKVKARTLKSSLFRVLSNHLTQKVFLFITHHYYKLTARQLFE